MLMEISGFFLYHLSSYATTTLQEMEKAIIEANSKYNDMLMEQLSKQEVLSRDYEDKLAALRRELEDAAKQCLQTALEKELGQLRALLNGEKETALLSLKREYEDRFNHMRDDLSNKLEKCISDLGIKKQAYTTLEKEKTELERLLLQQKEEMENKMANEMGSADQKLQNALIEAAQLKMQAVQVSDMVSIPILFNICSQIEYINPNPNLDTPFPAS